MRISRVRKTWSSYRERPTFSSFSLQTLNLANDGEWFQAGDNAVLSLVSCLVAVWLGHLAAVTINNLKGA